MKLYAIIVAGGKGTRMGGELPKQFLPLKGKPILMHTLEAFYNYNHEVELILVLPSDQQKLWSQLCRENHFYVPHQVVNGGETRFHSVKNGLDIIKEPGLVAVHDGVRPFVAAQVIDRCYRLADKKKAVIPVVEIVDSLREIDGDSSKSVIRSQYKAVQTPQVFESNLLKKAYEQSYQPTFTDDASVVEKLGYQIYLTEGNKENIKITTPFDLKIAQVLVDSCTI